MRRIHNMGKYIPGSASVNEMNDLAREIALLTNEKAEIFSGALEIESPQNINDLWSILRRLDNYKLYRDVSTPMELGQLLVDNGEVDIHKSALPYVDYARVAADYDARRSGVYTPGGYVVKISDNEPVQQPYVVKVILCSLRLEACEGVYSLLLPASADDLNDAMEVMGVKSFEECDVVGLESAIEALNSRLSRNDEIELLNKLADKLSIILKDFHVYDTFQAAVEVEQPDTAYKILDIASHIDRYDLAPSYVSDAEGYGEYVLYDSWKFNNHDANTFDLFKDEVRPFINYQEYAKRKMRDDGVRETSFGFLCNTHKPFPEAEETQDYGMTMSQ